jgi:probable phosphoglycerate mutase
VLYLVRHGRTEANARGLLQGRLDLPLDEVGHRQARAIAATVAAAVGTVDEVICSPLVRARETASYFASISGVDPVVDDRWIEIAYGDYEGVPAEEVPPEVWHGWRSDADYRTRDGESFGALDARVRSACEDLLARLGERHVVVVSHVSPIKAAVAWSLGVSMEMMFRCHLAQASLCRIDAGRYGAVLHSFNEQAAPGPTDE